MQEGLSGPGGGTSMDPPPDQEKHYMMVRNKKKGGGALPEFSLKDEPPKRKSKSPTKGYEANNITHPK